MLEGPGKAKAKALVGSGEEGPGELRGGGGEGRTGEANQRFPLESPNNGGARPRRKPSFALGSQIPVFNTPTPNTHTHPNLSQSPSASEGTPSSRDLDLSVLPE